MCVSFLYGADSDPEFGEELRERRKNRKASVIPMSEGLQTWVVPKQLNFGDGRRTSTSELTVTSKKKKATYEELRDLVNAGKVKEAKIGVRENDWDLKEKIRSRLWPLLDSIHETNRSSLDGFYWETATQLYGTEQGQCKL